MGGCGHTGMCGQEKVCGEPVEEEMKEEPGVTWGQTAELLRDQIGGTEQIVCVFVGACCWKPIIS